MGHLTIKPGLFDGDVPPSKTILQVLLDIGYPMHYSCRRGLCGQDMIRILKGALKFLSPKKKNPKTVRWRCCASTTSPCAWLVPYESSAKAKSS